METLTVLPLGPGAPGAPEAPGGPRGPGKPGAPATPAAPCRGQQRFSYFTVATLLGKSCTQPNKGPKYIRNN